MSENGRLFGRASGGGQVEPMERDLSGVKVAAPAELLAEEGLTKKLLPAAKSEGYGSCKSLTTVLGEVDAAITFHSLQVICLFFRLFTSLHFSSLLRLSAPWIDIKRVFFTS